MSDPGVVEAGIVAHLLEHVPDDVDHAVYGDVKPEPDADVFRDAIERVQETEPDVLVGVGGGSALDVAKTAGALEASDRDLLAYVASPIGEGASLPRGGVPTIAIPTTAGTGAETSPATVISLPDRQTKVGIFSRQQYPDLALLDPALTVSLPPSVTASAGIDALSQAIEAYTVRRFDHKPRADGPTERPNYGGRTPLTDVVAMRAITLLSANLRRAVANGEDLGARADLLLGSHLAGLAYTNAGVTVNHAIAMAVGGELHSPHGETVGILLPASLRYNAVGSPERHAEIAAALGVDTDGLERMAAARAAADVVEALTADIGLPEGLEAFGATPDDVTPFAKRTLNLERLTAGNPRALSLEAVESMIEQSL